MINQENINDIVLYNKICSVLQDTTLTKIEKYLLDEYPELEANESYKDWACDILNEQIYNQIKTVLRRIESGLHYVCRHCKKSTYLVDIENLTENADHLGCELGQIKV